MSIYQSRNKRQIANDITLFVPRSGGYAPARPPSSEPADTTAWDHLRKVEPANNLLPVTSDWLRTLPQNIWPRALVGRVPRIANLIAADWSKPVACGAYFDELLTDRRGSRLGFPADVYCDLLVLQDYYSRNVHLHLDY
jgi:hypothetical protein